MFKWLNRVWNYCFAREYWKVYGVGIPPKHHCSRANVVVPRGPREFVFYTESEAIDFCREQRCDGYFNCYIVEYDEGNIWHDDFIYLNKERNAVPSY